MYSARTGKSLLEAFHATGTWAILLFYVVTVGTMFAVQAVVTLITASVIAAVFGLTYPLWQISGIILTVSLFVLLIGKYRLLDSLMKSVIVLLTITTIVTLVAAMANHSPSVEAISHFQFSNQLDVFFLIALIGWMPAPLDISIWHSEWSLVNAERLDEKKALFDFKIGYLGTLSKIKGVEWLIEEFMKLSIDATLILAGKGHESYEKELFLMAADERIKFIGYTKPDEFFKTIDVLVVPSLWQEPLGMVAIEALANHIPVIANRSGGLQETVIDSVNGLFCESNKPESLGEAIEKLYWDAPFYNRLSASARNSVGEILNADRMISAYKTVVESVIEKFKKQTE
jgi:glycosyltransferase involved in cell wall biosynthesis